MLTALILENPTIMKRKKTIMGKMMKMMEWRYNSKG
jgi:hypothetical protein